MRSGAIAFTSTGLMVLFFGMAPISVYAQSGMLPGASGKAEPFRTGEELSYEILFGIFKIGEGFTKIDKKIRIVQSKPCYKVSLLGRTSGLISWITKVNDQLGAYVDTATLHTHTAYRKVREGSYQKDEIAVFDHAKHRISVKEKNKKQRHFGPPKVYEIPPDTYDILSGFLYVRTLDFHNIHSGDTIAFNAFIEDTVYRFQVVHRGTDVVSTPIGKIRCIKLIPIMPENQLFDGQDAISCWVSDDEHRIPIKLRARMFVGSFKIRIVGARGLEPPLNIVR